MSEHDGAAISARLLAEGPPRMWPTELPATVDLPSTVDTAPDRDDIPLPAQPPPDDEEYDLAARYVPLNWDQLWAETPEDADWIVPDVIERGRSYALIGAAKSGKSLLTLDLVAALVTGRALLGRPNPNPPLRVLYVDIENARVDIRQRLDAMGYGPADLDGLTYYSFPDLPALDSMAGGWHLLALAERDQPDLIVLDTVSRVVAGKENESDTFRALYRHALAPLKALGVTVLRLDHLGKDVTNGARGSSAKGDDVDTVWRLVDHGDGSLRLYADLQRSGHHPAVIDVHRRTLDGLRHVRSDGREDPRVTAVLRDLDRLGVPLDAGRDKARKALAEEGLRVRTEVLGWALAARRNGRDTPGDTPKTCSGTDLERADQAEIDYTCSEDQTDDDVSAGQTCPEQVGNSGNRSSQVPPSPPVPSPLPLEREQVGQDRSGTAPGDDHE